MTALSVSSSKQ